MSKHTQQQLKTKKMQILVIHQSDDEMKTHQNNLFLQNLLVRLSLSAVKGYFC